MRSEYILFALLVHFTALTTGSRVAEHRPSPVEMDEEAEETIRGFELSPRDKQAVFGDTSELAYLVSCKNEPSADIHLAIIKRLRVTDCHSSISKQLEGRCRNEKDQIEPNEAYRSDRTFLSYPHGIWREGK
jgi:hypothetical protein